MLQRNAVLNILLCKMLHEELSFQEGGNPSYNTRTGTEPMISISASTGMVFLNSISVVQKNVQSIIPAIPVKQASLSAYIEGGLSQTERKRKKIC